MYRKWWVNMKLMGILYNLFSSQGTNNTYCICVVFHVSGKLCLVEYESQENNKITFFIKK